jgi:hypothetical protein
MNFLDLNHFYYSWADGQVGITYDWHKDLEEDKTVIGHR